MKPGEASSLFPYLLTNLTDKTFGFDVWKNQNKRIRVAKFLQSRKNYGDGEINNLVHSEIG